MNEKILYILCGPPASGKTFIGKKLSPEYIYDNQYPFAQNKVRTLMKLQQSPIAVTVLPGEFDSIASYKETAKKHGYITMFIKLGEEV